MKIGEVKFLIQIVIIKKIAMNGWETAENGEVSLMIKLIIKKKLLIVKIIMN